MQMKIQQMDQQQVLDELAGRLGALKSAIAPDVSSDEFAYQDVEFDALEEGTSDALGILS
jgi:predicted transcriptional regulator